jgi:hypothetical protein
MKDTEKTSETKTAAGEQPAAAATHRIRLATPVVYRTSKKRRKRKYTNGLKQVQKMGLGVVRASDRLSDGLDRGFSTFRERTKSSSKKKRDGAIIDAVKNFTKAAAKSLRNTSKAPNDVLRRASWPLLG